MPGFYADGEYDVAGFIVGAVARDRLIDGQPDRAGDVLIGLPSSGLHTNGYSLARRIVFEIAGLAWTTRVPELGATVGDALLAPHRSYLPVIRPLLAVGRHQGHGAHHGRRHHRQSAAHAAGRHATRSSTGSPGRSRRSSSGSSARATCRTTTCCGRSTWASA